MHRFWDTIISPILELVQPKSIIEIGSDQGHNTAKLLEFCRQHGATLHAIDPLPKFDVAAWQGQYQQQFVFHQALSLNALPKVDRFDVVLIDGDHNWYTVFHELKLIEKRCAGLSQPLPLIFFHDINWPYGRRDLYYNPENIPDAYRQPYQKKGIRPEVAELQEKGGLNAHLCNAIYEHNLHNGVLTAVEDFLKEARQSLQLTQLPGLHGLGILAAIELTEQNLELRKFLKALELSPPVAQYVEKIEEERIRLDILRLQYSTDLRQIEGKQKTEIEEVRRNLQERHTTLQAREAENTTLRRQLVLTTETLSLAQSKLTTAEGELVQVRKTMQDDQRRLETEVTKLQQRVTESERVLAEREHRLSMYSSELKQRAQDITQLVSWIENFDRGFQSILDSKRWKLGHTLGSLYRKIRFKPPLSMPQDYGNDIRERFEAWRRSFRDRHKLEEKSHGKLEVPASSSLDSQAYSQEPKKKAASQKILRHEEKVSLIVLNRNGAVHLKNLFASFLAHNTYRNIEFIVVDHASSDNSLAVLRAWQAHLPIEIVSCKENYSFSYSNNEAAKKAGGQYVFFLNNDIIFDDDVLPLLLAQYHAYEPKVGLVGVKLVYPPHHVTAPHQVQHIGIKFSEDILHHFYRPYELGIKTPAPLKSAVPEIVPAVTGAALLCRREEFLSVGGFCEEYYYGYEDVDLCLSYVAQRKKASRCVTETRLIHDEGATRRLEGNEERSTRIRNNQKVLQKRYGYAIKKAVQVDMVQRTSFWTDAELVVAFAVTEAHEQAKAGDYFTAAELAFACAAQFDWQVKFLVRNQDWYDLDGVDILIVMVDSYDLAQIAFAKPTLIKIAWLRNWFERWGQQPCFSDYDIYLCSSQKGAQFLEEHYGKLSHVFRIATNERRFMPGSEREEYCSDYCFTGNYWNVDRAIESVLDPARLDYQFALYGNGWDAHSKFSRYWKGFVSYKELPLVYSSTKVVIDDANHVTKPWGSVNSRVFDALASGTLVFTNGDEGANEVFAGKLPTYNDGRELQSLLDRYLNDAEARRALVADLRKTVLDNHTYTHRAIQLQSLLVDFRDKKFRIAIKVPVPGIEIAHEWGDYHFALALKRALVKHGHSVRIDILPDWDTALGFGDDVVLIVQGPHKYNPKPDHINLRLDLNLMGEIIHEEYEQFDHVFVNSSSDADRLKQEINTPVTALLQNTGQKPIEESLAPSFDGNLDNSITLILKVIAALDQSRRIDFSPKDVIKIAADATEVSKQKTPPDSPIPTTPPIVEERTLSPKDKELYENALKTEASLPSELNLGAPNHSQEDLISIVTPTHNRAYVLKYCIQSVLAQSYQNFELFIVDDGSTDNTRQIVENFQATDKRIFYIYKPKTNVSDTRNVALKLARGKYVAFLDSDNVWDRNYLMIMHSYLSTPSSKEKVAYCSAHLFEEGVPKGLMSFPWGEAAFRSKPSIDLCTVFAELDAVKKVGCFDRRMTKWVDYELLIRLNNQFGDFLQVPSPLVFYFRLRDGLTMAPNTRVPMRPNMEIIWESKLAALKLAYVLDDFPALSQTFVVKEILHLQRSGIDVMVFHRLAPDKSAEVSTDLPVYKFDTGAGLVRLLKEKRRNFMHAHFAYPIPPNFVLPAAEETGIPFTFMPHAIDIFLKLNASRNGLAAVANSPLCRGVFAEGSFHKQFFVGQGVAAEKIRVVRNYCDEDEFWKEELRPLKRVKHFVTISRFQEKKGLHLLIQAFRKVRDRGLTLRLYGYGPQSDELRASAAGDSRIQILSGPSTAEEVKAILETADIFVLPCIETRDGDKDGLPTVLREAMAAGVLVLTTPISSIPDLIQHDVTGFLADSASVPSLTCRIQEILSLPGAQLLDIRKAAQKCIRNNFSKELTVSTLLDVWKKG